MENGKWKMINSKLTNISVYPFISKSIFHFSFSIFWILDSGFLLLKFTMGSPTEKKHIQEDIADLGRLGYAQELFRTMGGFSNFAISFSIISILTGAVTLYDHGLTWGGPAEMAFGWPLVCVFTLTVALSMGELAASYPTSGGAYHWSAILGGRAWGWFTAWFNIIGLITAIAGIDYGCAQFLTPLLGISSDTRTVLLVYAAILVSHGLI